MDLGLLLSRTGALLDGHFRLSSGLHSPNYVQCARLLEDPSDAIGIGSALADQLRPRRAQLVVAPALGGVIVGFAVAQALGLPFVFTERKEGAMALRRGFTIGDRKTVIVIEDVVTTGKSTRETVEAIRAEGANVVAYGSILNRSGKENPFDLPYVSLLSLALETYAPESCPLCRRDLPLDAPGSRFTATS